MITNAAEEWEFIPNYPNYEVSNLGRVRSWSRCSRNGRVLKPDKLRKGYLQVSITNKEGVCKKMRVHRLVLLAFVGECPDGMEVRHLDGTRDNNNLSNLAYGTRKENHADKIEHGTTNRGEKCLKSKLKEQDVQLVRLLLFFGWKQNKIAEIVGTSHDAIHAIKHGKSWSHLPLPNYIT